MKFILITLLFISSAFAICNHSNKNDCLTECCGWCETLQQCVNITDILSCPGPGKVDVSEFCNFKNYITAIILLWIGIVGCCVWILWVCLFCYCARKQRNYEYIRFINTQTAQI